VKRKEYSRASGSRPFSTRAATTTILAKRHYDGTLRSVPRAGSVMEGLYDPPIRPPKKVLPQNSPPQPPSLQITRFPPFQAATAPSRTRGTMLGREPQNLSPADHSRIRTLVRSDEQEKTSSTGFDDNGKVDEGLKKPNEVNAMALVFKKMKGKAWKSSENPVLIVSPTISKDNTAREEVQQAQLLAHFWQKKRSKASIWRRSDPLREPGGTTVESQEQPPAPAEDIYDPDDVGLHNSPPLKPMKVNFRPRPTPPPAVALPPVSPESSPEPPGRKGSNRSKYRPSQGDAVLLLYMDGGQHSNIARQARDETGTRAPSPVMRRELIKTQLTRSQSPLQKRRPIRLLRCRDPTCEFFDEGFTSRTVLQDHNRRYHTVVAPSF
jgi:hypothetical protein